ncbi:hypothetical protein BpHYR1_033498 [Brachionus plicatilis]|uniref:Uncharacterized protein n=1 Tax=Brachionus plicatilis TaxID=10195 RepID=A0A3M7PSJ6_BRAPC|nr:hypothetical protein BpHYR1_033498 [Brachionus plicatilis]
MNRTISARKVAFHSNFLEMWIKKKKNEYKATNQPNYKYDSDEDSLNEKTLTFREKCKLIFNFKILKV